MTSKGVNRRRIAIVPARFPDKELLRELKLLAETLEVERFEALSSGVGLGQLKVLSKRPSASGSQKPLRSVPPQSKSKWESSKQFFAKLPKARKEGLIPSFPTKADTENSSQVQKPSTTALKKQAAAPSRSVPIRKSAARQSQLSFGIAIRRLLTIHLVDLIVVSFALIAALICLTYLVEPREFNWSLNYLRTMLPWQLLSERSPLEWLGFIYAVFFAYLAFFRIVVGKTIGSALCPFQKEKRLKKRNLPA